jgi:hypothetical protein
MSDVVFILGAGASKQAGAPLMADFLDASRDLLAKRQTGTAEESFFNVFKAIGGLQSVHSKSGLDIGNVESVFGAFEMGKILKKLPGYDSTETDRLIHDMKVVISKTVEGTLRFPITGSGLTDRRFTLPEPYDAFGHLVDHLRKTADVPRSVAVITFKFCGRPSEESLVEWLAARDDPQDRRSNPKHEMEILRVGERTLLSYM